MNLNLIEECRGQNWSVPVAFCQGTLCRHQCWELCCSSSLATWFPWQTTSLASDHWMFLGGLCRCCPELSMLMMSKMWVMLRLPSWGLGHLHLLGRMPPLVWMRSSSRKQPMLSGFATIAMKRSKLRMQCVNGCAPNCHSMRSIFMLDACWLGAPAMRQTQNA